MIEETEMPKKTDKKATSPRGTAEPRPTEGGYPRDHKPKPPNGAQPSSAVTGNEGGND